MTFSWGRGLFCAAIWGIFTLPVSGDEARGPAISIMTGKAKEVTYYVDQTGVPTLTNRHESYRRDPAFEEVTIAFSPIVIPGRYRFGGGATQYTRGDIQYLVERYARQYGLDPNLVYAVIRAESNFNPYAVSRAGARGLMQLMPGTAAEMKVTDIFDPAQNIAGGTQYLAKMFQMFDNDLDRALAGYNAGPGAVMKHGGVPPFQETQGYIKKVRGFWAEYNRGGARAEYRLAGERPKDTYTPASRNAYTIHFRSGVTQPADAVEETATHYYIQFAGRSDAVRKELVAEIEKKA